MGIAVEWSFLNTISGVHFPLQLMKNGAGLTYMKKGYTLLVAGQLDAVLRAFHDVDFLVAIQYWLIQQLQDELKDKLTGVKIEVIKAAYHGAYPCLALSYDDPSNAPDISDLVETAIDQILQEKPVSDLITFFRTSGIDWSLEAQKIMGNR